MWALAGSKPPGGFEGDEASRRSTKRGPDQGRAEIPWCCADLPQGQPTDHEREARSIGTLVRSYEKVSVVKRESGDDDKQNGSRPKAEAIRRELAEQIVRLRKAEPGNAG